jgi:hypothetical protein
MTNTTEMPNRTTNVSQQPLSRESETPLANGPAAAAAVAAGIGCTVLGLMTILVEASPHHVKMWLNFYDPVGPLSGKTIIAVAAYAISWAILGRKLCSRNVNLKIWLTAAFTLTCLGLLGTFPLFYQMFTVKP